MKRIWGAAAAAIVLAGLYSVPALALEAPEGDEIADGIYVEDVSLGGKTYEEANAELDRLVEELRQTPVTVTFGGTVSEDGTVSTDKMLNTTLGDLGLSCRNETVLEGVQNVGKQGNAIVRYKQLKDLEKKKLVFELEYEIDDTAVNDFIQNNAPDFNEDVVDATITKNGGSFVVTPSAVGMSVDLEGTVKALKEAALSWESTEPLTVAAVVTETQPKYSYEALASIQYMMGDQKTYYNGAAGRNHNLVLGASLINGAVILPGETWSANAAMEPYTPDRGWQQGGSFTPDGKVEQTYGGGICQISSTLYNAAVKAEVGIAQRNNHSMVVTYLPFSQDAAIADDVKDLKLRNDYDFPIYIEGYASGGTLYFAVWGGQPGRHVELRSVTISYQEPSIEYQDDPTLPVGTEERVVSGHPGVRSAAYKQVFDENGQLIEETLLSEDSYRMSPHIYRRGTMPVPETPAETEPQPTEPQPPEPQPTEPQPTESTAGGSGTPESGGAQ
jgi:vancomycin resistance protein YoaR